MTQTIGLEQLGGEEPAAAIWRDIPNYREILAGLFDVVDTAQERARTAASMVGNVMLNGIDKIAS